MSKFVPLPGSQRKLLPNSRPAGPAARSEIINLTVRVRSVGNPGELEHLVREESNTPLAERRYLSRKELAARFGGDPIDLNTVETYAAQHNLVVVRRSSAERSIVLQGALGDMLHAFPAHVATYHHRTGTYRGRTGEIQIPRELEGTVTSILGFDTRPKTRHSLSRRISAAAGPGGQNGETGEFFAQRYRFPEQIGGAPLDGYGQAIGIIELGGGFQMSDLSAYFAKIGSPMPNVSFVSVDGASNNPGINEQLDGEVMLDIEVIGAVSPGRGRRARSSRLHPTDQDLSAGTPGLRRLRFTVSPSSRYTRCTFLWLSSMASRRSNTCSRL